MHKRIRFFSLFVFLLLFSCYGSSYTGATEPQSPSVTHLPSNTAFTTHNISYTPTVTLRKPTNVSINNINILSPSLLVNDGRIWVMSSITVLDEGTEETGCTSRLQTGQLFQSNDGGHTWELTAPPVTFSLSLCLVKQEMVDIYSHLDIVPYAGGIIIQFRLAGSILPDLSPILFWDGDVWNQIPSPISEYQEDDPKEIGGKEIRVLPDGSGNIVAIGNDSDGISHFWLLESPLASWKDITSIKSPYNTIDSIVWSYAHGLVGVNKSSSVIFLRDNEGEWTDLHYPNNSTSLNKVWMGISGEICTTDGQSSDDTPILGWDGSKWNYFDVASNCSPSPMWIAYQDFAIFQFYPLKPDDISGLFINTSNGNQFQEIILPSESEYIEKNNLVVTQDGIIYYINNNCLYSSSDTGGTWEIVYGDDLSG